MVIDEVFTHDSSRFVRISQYERDFEAGREPRWIDKEYARNYLKSVGFKGDGPVPDMPNHVIEGVTKRVIEASELIMGSMLSLPPSAPTDKRIVENLKKISYL